MKSVDFENISYAYWIDKPYRYLLLHHRPIFFQIVLQDPPIMYILRVLGLKYIHSQLEFFKLLLNNIFNNIFLPVLIDFLFLAHVKLLVNHLTFFEAQLSLIWNALIHSLRLNISPVMIYKK